MYHKFVEKRFLLSWIKFCFTNKQGVLSLIIHIDHIDHIT